MTKEECFFLGYVTKLFGYEGDIVIFLDVDSPEKYSKLESVFIEIKGKLIPFFIDNIRIKHSNSSAIVRLQGIDNIEKASTLVNSELYLPLSYLPQLKGTNFYYHEIVDFEVYDKSKGFIGTIKSVIDLPVNPLLQIFFNKTEILIPIIPEIIKNLDRKNKYLEIDAPEGLIDIYLDNKEEKDDFDE